MKYVIMYYSAIFWVLLRVTRFLLFNYIMHSLVLFKKKTRKINIWIRHNFEAIGRISTKRLHTSSYMYSSPGWTFRVWRLHTLCNGKNPNICYLNTILCIIYFEDKRSVPNMDSIVYLQYLEGITVFWHKKVSANKFSLVQSILLPIFVGMEEHFATIILFKLRTTGVFTQDHF